MRGASGLGFRFQGFELRKDQDDKDNCKFTPGTETQRPNCGSYISDRYYTADHLSISGWVVWSLERPMLFVVAEEAILSAWIL